MNLIKDDYFEQHYFIKSGIILEKSMLPYIFKSKKEKYVQTPYSITVPGA